MSTMRRLKILSKIGLGVTLSFHFIPKALESSGLTSIDQVIKADNETKCLFQKPLPSRNSIVEKFKEGKEYDILIIGGGATGCGIALDASSRGLNTCLVEKFDFASGTSSRSTKLIHGGVRYLQKAIFELNYEQYKMVNEALSERTKMIKNAPHITDALPIMLPIYKLWQVPYYWFGIKSYDVLSGFELLKASYYLNKKKTLEKFPLLKKNGLKGAIIYYDGQMDDARYCLNLAISAIRYGASAINYTECVEIIKDEKQKVIGAKLRDRLTDETYVIKAKCVINATGPYTDSIRKMSNEEAKEICQPSSGAHIVLPDYYSPSDMGLLDPNTRDGRVIFFLPWLKGTLAGTTDIPCTALDHPTASEKEISFILDEIDAYFSKELEIRRDDVLSAWSGVRPLVRDPNSQDTQSIARNHVIELSPNGLVTIAGGKWTTYRMMAEETVDKCIKEYGLKPDKDCQTKQLLLEGAHNWEKNDFISLVQDYNLEVDIAKHLSTTYGDKASNVISLSSPTGKKWPAYGRRLHPEYPYLEAEVVWACNEYACRAVDFLARRTRLSFLNINAAYDILPRVVEIMGDVLRWDSKKRELEKKHAIQFLKTEMSYNDIHRTKISSEEVLKYHKEFLKMDTKNNGFIEKDHVKKFLESKKIEEEFISEAIKSLKGDQIKFADFLKVIRMIESKKFSYSNGTNMRPTFDRLCGDV